MEFNKAEMDRIAYLASKVTKSYGSKELKIFFSNKFYLELVSKIYSNLGYESSNISKTCGTLYADEIKLMIERNHLAEDDFYNLKIELHLMALQLKLLDDIKVPDLYRDKAIEDAVIKLIAITKD